jgi:hypothetical protein
MKNRSVSSHKGGVNNEMGRAHWSGYWGKNLVRIYFELGALRTVCDARSEVLAAMQKNF